MIMTNTLSQEQKIIGESWCQFNTIKLGKNSDYEKYEIIGYQRLEKNFFLLS
jgi:hypothetical protein